MASNDSDLASLYLKPVELLQNLVRFESLNPPGLELDCVMYIGRILDAAGIPWITLAKDENRPNLIARLAGDGSAPPLLMQGHVDVVPVEGQDWEHPPFDSLVKDDCVWGRGTLDMKGGLTMMIAALLRARAEGLAPAGDIVFVALCDEESGGDYGARFLAAEHPEHFEGIRYGVGEVGGFSMHFEDRRFYPIEITEKQVCWLGTTITGPGGHGSVPMRDGAMAAVGEILTALNTHSFPVHVTPAARMMIESLAGHLPEKSAESYAKLLDPKLTNDVLATMGEAGRSLYPILHNTCNATMIEGGSKINVIPSAIELKMDCRLLPGFGPEDMIREIRQLLGRPDLDFRVVRFDPVPARQDMGMFGLLEGILRSLDPDMAAAVPLLVSGGTDGRYFSNLGIQTYGFTPMRLPEGMEFMQLAHAADERVPIEALEFGVRAMYNLLERYGREG